MARTDATAPRRGSGRRWVAAAAATLLGGALAAHDTWLMPAGAFRVPLGQRAALAMTSAMRFPVPETAIRPERVERATLRLGDATTPLVVGAAARGVLTFRTEPLAAAGIATAGVSLAPRTLTLTRAQVAHYLDEIGADSAVRAAYARGDGSWTETYVKHTKTFLRVGDGAADTSWRTPIGQRLELVPRVDPTTLRAGTRVAVQLLRCGAPLAGQAVGWVRGGSTRARLASTDADGVVQLTLDRPGRWLLRTTTLHRRDAATPACALPLDPTTPDAEWRSDFATLVLEVR